MIVSNSIHVAANDIISVFLWLSNIPLHICTTSYLLIPLCGNLGYHILVTVNNAAVNIRLHISF